MDSHLFCKGKPLRPVLQGVHLTKIELLSLQPWTTNHLEKSTQSQKCCRVKSNSISLARWSLPAGLHVAELGTGGSLCQGLALGLALPCPSLWPWPWSWCMSPCTFDERPWLFSYVLRGYLKPCLFSVAVFMFSCLFLNDVAIFRDYFFETRGYFWKIVAKWLFCPWLFFKNTINTIQ